MKFIVAVVIIIIFGSIAVGIINVYLSSSLAHLEQVYALGLAQIKQVIIPKSSSNLDKEIKVDLSQQRAFLFEKGVFIMGFKISSGKLETPTPKGVFQVIYKQNMIYSKIAGCWLSFWVGFTSDGKYGFHETPICNGQRQGEENIGQPASAGCLRLKQGKAEQLYDWTDIGTKIEIY